MGKERRKHPRVSISVDVDFSSTNNFYTGQARDISLGGIFVETDVVLPVGEEISVTLALDGESFTVVGEVAWEQLDESGASEGWGMRFVDLAPQARSAVERFMEKRSPIEFEVEAELEAEAEPESRPQPPPLPKA